MNAKDFKTLFGVALRRQRLAFAAWIGAFCLVLAVIPNAYRNNLGSMELRRSVIEMMNSNAGTRLLFGTVPQPGTVGQLVQWETGMLLLVFTSIAAILIVTTVGRRGEDDGLRELVEGTGVSRVVVFAVQAAIGTAFSLAAGFSCGLVLAVQAPLFSEISVAGSVCLGIAIALAGCVFSAIALVASQLADDAVGARRISFVALFAAFSLRVGAVAADWDRVQWLTPLGWKELLEPYTADRFLLAIPMALAALALAALAWRLYSRRELHGAYLRSASRSGSRLRAAGVFSRSRGFGRRRVVGGVVGVVAEAGVIGCKGGCFVTL